MFLMTVEKTVLRSCFKTPWSWKVWRVVSRRVPLPYCADRRGEERKREGGGGSEY
jgi:hypothetical protein